MYEYPDEAFAHMAHLGMTAVAVWLSDPYTTLRGDRIDLNLLCKRAKKYGLDIGVTLDAPHNKAPGDPGAQEYYDKMYGELFCVAPDISLVSIAGETAVYPSADERVGRMSGANNYNDNIPVKKAHPANWPCRDFPEFVAMIERAIKKHNKNAQLILSTYNWGYAPEEDRFAVIKNLPKEIIIQPTWDMFHQYKLGNSIESISDYSLSFVGPGEYFVSEAELAKKLGIELNANAQCSGRTWDFGVIPYEPMPGQWIRRYEALRKAHEQWDLSGVAENIHYGFYPSMISELEKWAFLSPYEPLNKILEQILIRDYGKANAAEVKKALDLFDEAITHYVPTNEDQYGAFRIGPTYPFWLEESSQNLPGKGKKPNDIKAMFGNNIYLSKYTENCTATSAVDRLSLAGVRIYDEIDSNKKMSDLLLAGINILKACENPNLNLIKLCGLAEFIYRSTQTVINLKEFFILTQQLNIAGSSEKAAKILAGIENILLKEKENVEATIPIVQADSSLGWEPSMEYTTDEKGLRWKLKQLDYTMDFLLPIYKRATQVEI
ncbi:MAG: hypothetical protein IKW59_02480 [Clostridia bacterium]|nr:hypothetical protein [Clostridia bacterium]